MEPLPKYLTFLRRPPYSTLTNESPTIAAPATPLGVFDSLPAEIRLEIYRFALIAPVAFSVRRGRRGRHGNLPLNTPYEVSAMVPIHSKTRPGFMWCGEAVEVCLLRVSKVVHAEAARVFYRCNRFVFVNYAALSTFLLTVNEMGFFLADVELRSLNLSPKARHPGSFLKRLRISSHPQRIALPTPNIEFWPKAEENAAIAWSIIEPIVKREGQDSFDSAAVAGLRSHMHTQSHGRNPKCSYAALTEHEQRERLKVFQFKVPAALKFRATASGGEVEIEDWQERARRFNALVLERWRADVDEKRTATSRRESET